LPLSVREHATARGTDAAIAAPTMNLLRSMAGGYKDDPASRALLVRSAEIIHLRESRGSTN